MILHAVERLPNIAAPRVSHGANQPIAPRDFIFVRLQQINAPQPNLRRILRQLINRNVGITPLANRLMNASLASRLYRAPSLLQTGSTPAAAPTTEDFSSARRVNFLIR